jgi:hypothetical protein
MQVVTIGDVVLNVQEIEQASVFSGGRRDEKLNEQVKIGGARDPQRRWEAASAQKLRKIVLAGAEHCSLGFSEGAGAVVGGFLKKMAALTLE